MKFKLIIAALMIAPLALTACAKKEETSKADAVAEAPADVQISAEQQAAIDSVDQPIAEAIAIDETVVAEANAETAAAEAEKNGAAPAEAVIEPAVATSEETSATQAIAQ